MTDIKHFYLNNNLPEVEYMKIQMLIIPQEILTRYNLEDLVDVNGWIYIKTCKACMA